MLLWLFWGLCPLAIKDDGRKENARTRGNDERMQINCGADAINISGLLV